MSCNVTHNADRDGGDDAERQNVGAQKERHEDLPSAVETDRLALVH